MKTNRKPASALLAAGLHESGLIDMRRLRQYDAPCPAPVPGGGRREPSERPLLKLLELPDRKGLEALT